MAASLDADIVNLVKEWADSPGSPLPAKLKAIGDAIPWQTLLNRVGDLANENPSSLPAKIALLDPKASTSVDQGGWTWGASASGDVSLEIGLVHGDDLATLGITPALGHQVASYGAVLDLSAGLNAGGPVGAWGQASGKLSAATQAQIHWYVLAANTDRLVDAAVAAVPYWRLPNDLDGLLAIASDSMFWGVVLDLHGTLEAAFQAGVQAPTTGWAVRTADGTARIGLNIGLQANAQLQVDGQMQLHVRPEQRQDLWGLKVELHVQRSRDAQAGLTFEAGLDLSAVVASAEQAIRAGWPELNQAWLTDLTQPGTAIQQELASLIKANVPDADLQQLALLTLGQGSAADASSTLLSRASGALADAIDGALGKIADGSAQAQDILGAWLKGLLGTGAAAQFIEGKLQGAAAAALGRASDFLKAKATDLEKRIEDPAQGKLEQLLAPLGAFGAKLKAALDRVDNNSFSKAIASALADYAKARQSLLDALSDAQKAKLSATLSEQIEVSRAGTLAFAGWFSPQGDRSSAQRLYQALCAGRIRLLGDLVQAATTGLAFELDEGWISGTKTRTQTQSATLSLLGADFTSSRVNLVDMQFQTDLWGRLMAGAATAGVDAKSIDPWVGREATLSLQANVQVTSGSVVVSIDLEGAFTTTGKRTSQAFAQNVVDSYARSMGAHNRLDLASFMGAPGAPADRVSNFWRGFTLALPLSFAGLDWETFTSQTSDAVGRAFLRRGLDCLNALYTNSGAFRFTSPEQAIRDRANDAVHGGDDAGRMLAYLGQFRAMRVSLNDTDYGNDVGFDFNPPTNALPDQSVAFNQFLVVHRFAGVLRAAQALLQAGPALRTAVGDGSQLQTPDALMARVGPVLTQVCATLDPIAVADETLVGLGAASVDQGVAWPFNTFALAMAQLTGRSVPPAFLLTAKAAGTAAPTSLPIL